MIFTFHGNIYYSFFLDLISYSFMQNLSFILTPFAHVIMHSRMKFPYIQIDVFTLELHISAVRGMYKKKFFQRKFVLCREQKFHDGVNSFGEITIPFFFFFFLRNEKI